uniref:uncharacterized protein LOC122584863 n=1 Tax=Erigeron canadensis TaxID=72917 RepID=UPI001CB8A52E|nr:uncharacterized protein LOC122584863 [Erigeron canadensis]XP_043612872.1 uncharacterized protein LOC122584863 [Erigeron canadensis]XP_043612873.1 uncharacterized protein LOC122584863 [Erigeron canadensis]
MELLYWLAYDRNPVDDTGSGRDYRELIMSFDLTSEEFTEIYLPGDKDYYYGVFISKLKESLVVLDSNVVDEKLVCDVWKMEHGISKTFTKLYTISMPEPSIELDRVFGFRNSGEPIVAGYIDSEGCFELDSEERSQQIAIFVYEPD